MVKYRPKTGETKGADKPILEKKGMSLAELEKRSLLRPGKKAVTKAPSKGASKFTTSNVARPKPKTQCKGDEDRPFLLGRVVNGIYYRLPDLGSGWTPEPRPTIVDFTGDWREEFEKLED